MAARVFATVLGSGAASRGGVQGSGDGAGRVPRTAAGAAQPAARATRGGACDAGRRGSARTSGTGRGGGRSSHGQSVAAGLQVNFCYTLLSASVRTARRRRSRATVALPAVGWSSPHSLGRYSFPRRALRGCCARCCAGRGCGGRVWAACQCWCGSCSARWRATTWPSTGADSVWSCRTRCWCWTCRPRSRHSGRVRSAPAWRARRWLSIGGRRSRCRGASERHSYKRFGPRTWWCTCWRRWSCSWVRSVARRVPGGCWGVRS